MFSGSAACARALSDTGVKPSFWLPVTYSRYEYGYWLHAFKLCSRLQSNSKANVRHRQHLVPLIPVSFQSSGSS